MDGVGAGAKTLARSPPNRPAQILFAKVRYGSFTNAQMETIITDPSEIEVFEYLLCVFEDNLGRLD
jgi:hypothetical protein